MSSSNLQSTSNLQGFSTFFINSGVKKEYIINQDGAVVIIYRNWYPAEYSSNLLKKLINDLEWQNHKHNLGPEPRLTYPMGDPGTLHGYTDHRRVCQAWLPEVEWFRKHFNQHLGVNINSALLNYYKNGQDYIAYHSDSEVKPPRNMVIALSLGQTRKFYFKRKFDNTVIKTTINNGDLMIMYGRCQELYKHSIPKQDTIEGRAMKDRISITFRELAN